MWQTRTDPDRTLMPRQNHRAHDGQLFGQAVIRRPFRSSENGPGAKECPLHGVATAHEVFEEILIPATRIKRCAEVHIVSIIALAPIA